MTQPKPQKARKPQAETTMLKMEMGRRAASFPSFDDLPNSALARQAQLVRDPRHPTRQVPLPFSPATFWRKAKEDSTFPKPVKLGKRITAWRVGDVRAWIEAQAAA